MSWKVRVHQKTESGVRHRTVGTYPDRWHAFWAVRVAADGLKPGDTIEIRVLPEVSPPVDQGR